ncbi:uncharacterized protein LOC129744823 [Uranotaenia lowii]|uniref:uncharacterized protein LOC129744823 n=1 Tax=Uranotaenia lowii TaxID=190385 RepID=UPI002478E545|nr:uncharacterized protein LOC129744823 [Uranotaenia lowii]
MKVLWITFAAIAIAEGFYLPQESFYDESYQSPEYYEALPEVSGDDWFLQMARITYDWLDYYAPFLDEQPRYMSFVAPQKSLIDYTPVQPGSSERPNVFVEGQGYTTNRYVAPKMVKRYLAMNPR